MYSFNSNILNLIFYQKVLARLMSDAKSVVSSEWKFSDKFIERQFGIWKMYSQYYCKDQWTVRNGRICFNNRIPEEH